MTNIPTVPHHFTVSLSSEGRICFFYCAEEPMLGLRLTPDRARVLGSVLIDYANGACRIATGDMSMSVPECHTSMKSGGDYMAVQPSPRSSVRNFDGRSLVAQTLTVKHGLATRDVRWEVRDERGHRRLSIVGEVADENTIVLNLATTGFPETMHGTWRVEVTEKKPRNPDIESVNRCESTPPK